MARLTEFAAFIFDMDGLVLDTEPAYFAAWQNTLSALGYAADLDFFRSFSGLRFKHIQQHLYETFGDDFDIATFKTDAGRRWRKHVSTFGIPVKTGVVELLDFADTNAIPVCLATNSPAMNAQECLGLAGLSRRFPIVISGDDVENPKPAPDVFLKAAERLGVDITCCIVFEDSHPGVEAAAKAGACCAYIPSAYPVRRESLELCDYLFDDLTQLMQSLAKP